MPTSSVPPDSIPWDQLLVLVEGGHVVPVVGEELLVPENSPVSYYAVLARRLAEHLDVRYDPGDSLNVIAYRVIERTSDVQQIYPTLKLLSESPELSSLGPYPALAKLAAISHFQLFVSTTVDTLLQGALNDVRYGGKRKTSIVSYNVGRPQDLPTEIEQLERATVYHLLGRISAVPDYAVTDEDLLEFVSSLQSDARRPRTLFQELSQKRLLVIGSTLSDWLFRFFLRATKPEPLSLRRTGDYVVRPGRSSDLVMFLQNFYGKSLVFDISPVEFVDELHRRWKARNGTHGEQQRLAPTPPEGMAEGAVFISYASEDRGAAQHIRNALESAGIDAWFDRDQLGAGDRYDERIMRAIERSSLFVPLISEHVLSRAPRYFRREWTCAERVLSMVSPRDRYVVPAILDDTSMYDDGIPATFQKLHYHQLPGGRPTSEFVETIKAGYRNYQRSRELT